MAKKLHIIYITGLGDDKVTGQQRAINTWHWYGVEAEMFQVKWADGEPWESKFKRLLARIDAAVADCKDVGLVGISAGGSALINAFAARKDKVVGAVCISGKINNPQTVGGKYRSENPAFVTSSHDCAEALKTLTNEDRTRILSRYALFDGIVPKKNSHIPGAHNQFSPSILHVPTITLQITLGAHSLIGFLKRNQQ